MGRLVAESSVTTGTSGGTLSAGETSSASRRAARSGHPTSPVTEDAASPVPALPDEAIAEGPAADHAPPRPTVVTDGAAGRTPGPGGPEASSPGLLDRFSLGDELGRGGMGRVIEAWDPHLRRTIAIKTLLEHRARRDSTIARFLGEARLNAQLEHPGIVPVHELGETADGRPYFVMKRVRGRSLRKVIVSLSQGEAGARREWTTRRLLTLFVQVCNAVAYAHDRGVLHRDLKPENIMLGDYGEAVVMDWGLARPMDSPGADPEPQRPGRVRRRALHRTQDGVIVGTPGYISPEQARRGLEDLDARSDVWSLGAILYEMLTLQRAYASGAPATVLLESAGGPPQDPRERAPDEPIPAEIAEVCLKALTTDRDDRFGSARALAEAVEAFLDGSQRREQALALVDEARQMLPSAERLRARATSLRRNAEEKLRSVPPWSKDAEKAAAWELQDQADRAIEDADLLETDAEERLHHALSRFPALPEARAALADLYQERMLAAEEARDRAGARRHERMLRAYDEGAHAAFLRGEGAISMRTDPPGAEALLYRFVEVRRRLMPVLERSLGATPLIDVPVAMGSYLVVIRCPGRAEVRYPVDIPRLQHWDGTPPGMTEPAPIYLPAWSEIGPDDVYVPAGWTRVGGDAQAPGSVAGARIWVDGFVLARNPVTNDEYLAFLDDLVGSGREALALEAVPRERASSHGDQGAMIYGRDADGRFVLARDADGDAWLRGAPAVMVDWRGANAYAAWRAERTGLPFRLPSEWEHEKAARGVDGRAWPWGDFLDPSWVCMRESHAGRPIPVPIDRFPDDESAYGARGLAGNVRDWCVDLWIPSGGLAGGQRLFLPSAPGDLDAVHPVRGGSYAGVAALSRAASRHGHPARTRTDYLGFRVARPLG